jgi:type I restriction enzyme, S subunit
LPIPLPPEHERQEIVAKLNSISVNVGRAEETYREKLAALRELKEAILQKAFSGSLTSPPSRAIKEAAE